MNSWQHAIDYLLSCRPSHYVWWQGGEVSPGDSAPAWADNTPPPPSWRIQREGGFCIAAANLMMRDVGATIPSPMGDPAWDGGTLSSYKGLYDVSQWFNPQLDYPDLWFLISPYKEDGWGNMVQEGHGAVTYEGYCVEWIHKGLVWEFTTYDSHVGWGKYEIAVPPSKWLGKDSGGGTPVPNPIPTKQPSVFTPQMLIDAMTSATFIGPNIDPADAHKFFPAIAKYCQKYEINTKARLSQWLGQMGHESASFQIWGEIGQGGGAFGDFYGGGPGQLTWEDTYRAFQDATGWPAHDNPDIVRDRDNPEPGFEACCWLWSEKGLNYWADFDTYTGYSEITYRWLGTSVHPSVPEREARYAHAWSTLPEDLVLQDTGTPGTPIQGGLLFAKYNLCAIGQPYTDFINAAVLALESQNIDAMALNGPTNIQLAASQADDAHAVIPVGTEAYLALPDALRESAGWSPNSTIWWSDHATPGGALVFVRNWAMWWISTQAEVANYVTILSKFDDYLIATLPSYEDLIKAASSDTAPDPPPPPEMEELLVAFDQARPTDKVKVYRPKGR